MSITRAFHVLFAAYALALFGCSGPAQTGAAGTDGADGAGGAQSDAEGAAAPAVSGTAPSATAGASEGAASEGTIALTAENTTLEFLGTKDDGKHDGGFRELNGTIQVAGDEVESIAVTVKTESLWADNPKLEGHLKNPDFFEVQAHPELSFASTRIEPGPDGGTHTIAGDLTMLGQTHPIEIPATIEVSADEVHVKSQFTIDRTKWGMNYRPDQVHKEVQITVTIDAAR